MNEHGAAPQIAPLNGGMLRAQSRTRFHYQMDLRDYIIWWRQEHPFDELDVLARELRVHVATVYRWIDRLAIAKGQPALIDLLKPAASCAPDQPN